MTTNRERGWRAWRDERVWSNEEEAHALHFPWERRSMDVLEGMLRLDMVSAREALEAIDSDAHGGWIAVLLEVKILHLRWGLAHVWEGVMAHCQSAVREQPCEDLRVVRNDACRALRPVTILRPSRWSATTEPHAYPGRTVRRRAALVRHYTGRARVWSSHHRMPGVTAGPDGNLVRGR